MAEWLKEKRAGAAVPPALGSIAWTFNVRGQDVARTPVARAFALVHADGTADLYIDEAKLDDDVRAHLGNAVRVHSRGCFGDGLSGLWGKTVVVDPASAVTAIFERLEQAGAKLVEARDPAVLPKAVKNPVEIAGTKAAHQRDGAALTRFLHWVALESPKGGLDELTASDKLHALRKETGELRDLSFDTISGAGPNGAVVHYRASERSEEHTSEPQSLMRIQYAVFCLKKKKKKQYKTINRRERYIEMKRVT